MNLDAESPLYHWLSEQIDRVADEWVGSKDKAAIQLHIRFERALANLLKYGMAMDMVMEIDDRTDCLSDHCNHDVVTEHLANKKDVGDYELDAGRIARNIISDLRAELIEELLQRPVRG